MKLAITGMIASGKSAVLKRLQELGWLTISADVMAWAVIESKEGREFMEANFGGREPGKDELREKFFGDRAFRAAWEGFIHPRVRALWAGAMAGQPQAHWAVEVPLLFEKKLEREFDDVVVCSCSTELALFRWEAKRRSKETYQELSKLLIPIEEKCSRAHYVITNNSSLESLLAQVDAIHAKIFNQQSNV